MMFYAFVLVTIGIFSIDPFEGVDADGKIKNYFHLMKHRRFDSINIIYSI